MSNTKKILFSIIALLLVPLVILTIIELGLRLAGVGKSYEYFAEIDINGEAYYQDNKEFANQFYPASLGIAPLNNTFSVERPDNLVRVYILGGSAAQGFPHKNHGLTRHLNAHLRAALPDKKIEVINTAMTSVNSHVVYEVAKGIPDDSADFAVILMGNNEVVGPYGPSTFSQNFSSNMRLIRFLQGLKRTHIWQGLAQLIQQARPASDKEQMVWQGMQMFTEFSVPHDDTRLNSVYQHYATNLREIIEILQDKGIHVIVSTVPVNLRDSAPFGSKHSPDISDTLVQQWQRLNTQADQYLINKRWDNAIVSLQAAIDIDPEYADTHFKLATALENVKQYELAMEHYQKALNLDTLRFRTDSRLNESIARIAENNKGELLSFVDSAKSFERASAPYAPGWNLLHEHVHFDYSGNYVLARDFTQAILTNIEPSRSYKRLSSVEAAQWIGFPNHETVELMGRLEKMIKEPPFTKQSNAEALIEITSKRKDAIAREVGTPGDVIKRRQPIVQSGHADWKIHFELAALNKFLRNKQETKYHYKEIFKTYPHSLESHVNMAEILSQEQTFNETVYHLEQALHYTRGNQTEIVKIYGLLGLTNLRLKNYDEARDYLHGIIDDYPEEFAANFRAYGSLIKYTKENGMNRDLNRYVGDAQRYANLLIKRGNDKDFPLLYRRMAQIMTLAGRVNDARAWQAMQPQKSAN